MSKNSPKPSTSTAEPMETEDVPEYLDEELSQYFFEEPFAEEIARLSQQPDAKIRDLQSPQLCPLIIVQIHSWSKHGLSRTVADNKLYFTFVIADDTGEMSCTAFTPHAAELAKIVESHRGFTLDITGGVVEQLEPTAHKCTNNNYHMLLTENTSVKVYTSQQILYNYSQPTVVPEKVKVQKPPVFVPTTRKRPAPLNVTQTTIAGLNFAHKCRRIELKVKAVITPAAYRGKTGKSFFRFLGYDDTGEICCTAFEPLALQLSDRVTKDATLEIKGGVVMPVDPVYSRHCDNQFEMKLFKDAEVTVLRTSSKVTANVGKSVDASRSGPGQKKAKMPVKDKMQPVQDKMQPVQEAKGKVVKRLPEVRVKFVKSVAELKYSLDAEIVDFTGVVVKSDLYTKSRKSRPVAYREVSLRDDSGATVILTLYAGKASNFDIPTGTAIIGRKLKVRVCDGKIHLAYIQQSSIAAVPDENAAKTTQESPKKKKRDRDVCWNIADMYFPHICGHLRVKIKSILTLGSIFVHPGESIQQFIVQDDTGEMHCTLYETHSVDLVDITEGTTLDIRDATVRTVEGKFDPFNNTKAFDLHVCSYAEVTVLDRKVPPGGKSRLLESLSELAFCKALECVDCMGVLVQDHLDTMPRLIAGEPTAIPYRELRIIDSGGTTADIILTGHNAVDFCHPLETFICGRRLMVRNYKNKLCCFFTEESSIVQADPFDIRMRSDAGNLSREIAATEAQIEENGTNSSHREAPGEVVASSDKEPDTKGGEKIQIGDITSIRTCPLMRITVKHLITEGPTLSNINKYFVRFVACDATGEICCTVFEPLSLKFAEDFKRGAILLIENAIVEKFQSRFQSYCEHEFQIQVHYDATITVVKPGYPPLETEFMRGFASMHKYRIYQAVDIIARLTKSEVYVDRRDHQDVEYRLVTVRDCHGYKVDIIMFGELMQDYVYKQGDVLLGKNLILRVNNCCYQLVYGPYSSLSLAPPNNKIVYRLLHRRGS